MSVAARVGVGVACLLVARGVEAKPVRTSFPAGPVSWYEVDIPDPAAQRVEIRVAVRVEPLRAQIRASITPSLQAAVSKRITQQNWFNFRFSNFRPTIDGITIGPGARPEVATILVSGRVMASQERLLWKWHGMFDSGLRWIGQGDRDVVSYRAPISVNASITTGSRLADQTLVFDPVPQNNSVTVNLNPIRGLVLSNLFSVPKPSQVSYPLRSAAESLPTPMQGVLVRSLHFVSFSDTEIVIEADAS